MEMEYERVLKCDPFEHTLKEIIEDDKIIEGKFGKEMCEIYLKGVRKFVDDFKIEVDGLSIIGPSVEGVGKYPKLLDNLKVEGENIFAIGDCSGIFRGIIPSMVSGHFIGNLLRPILEKK